jgi:flavin reductase (DIM6/NTAB) family NADH-FMN oxidoreductase RutF
MAADGRAPPIHAVAHFLEPNPGLEPASRSRNGARPSLDDMPVKEGPVPPFPEGADPDEYDRLRRRVLWKMPSGLYVVGSTDKAQRRNGMTLNWATQLSFDPKWLGVSIEREAFTHELIAAGGVFALCLIDREDRAIVRKFTKPVEVDLDARTLNGFEYFDGPATNAPVLSQAVAYVECEVRQTVDIGNHTLFCGEVVNAAFLKDEATEVLRMEDTRMNYGG